MENQNGEQVVGMQEGQQVQQQPQQNGQQVQQEPEQKGFGKWLKRNWKKIAVAASGAAAIGGSAVVAYKRGKAAGIQSVPYPTEPEDYSLDPNKE